MPNPPTPAGRIPFSVASLILEALVRYCPDIRILQLAPNDDQRHPATLDMKLFNVPLFRAALECQPSRPWYRVAQDLTLLQHLAISEGWLYPPSLQMIGSLPELESLTIVPGPLNNFDYMFDINPTLPDGSFSNLTKLSILELEAWGVGAIFEIQDLIRRLTTIKLEFYFDEPDRHSDEKYSEVQRIFQGLRGTPYLRELRIFFPFDPEEGERAANVYHVMEDMGPHSLLKDARLDGIRIDKEDRRICHSIRKLSSIWPNVQTLSMLSQHASIRDLEDFATLPSLRHPTVKLNLKHPYLPAKPNFKAAPLKTLTSSGPVRLSTIYKDLCLSARALLILWPSLERVIWSDEDPTRMKLADFFNSEVLRFTREFLFRAPQEDAQMSATRSMREVKALFKSIPKDLCELGSDSDSDSDSDWNPKSNASVAEELESE